MRRTVKNVKCYFQPGRQFFLHVLYPSPAHALNIIIIGTILLLYAERNENLSKCSVYWTCLNLLNTGSCISSAANITWPEWHYHHQHPQKQIIKTNATETAFFVENTIIINSYSRCNLWLCRWSVLFIFSA